jgi:membrane fusion protein, multidrug efflux system
LGRRVGKEPTMSTGESRPRRLRRAIISLFIILLGGIGVYLVARIPAPRQEVPPREAVTVNVEVLAVQPIPQMPDVLELPGALEPMQVVNIPVEQRGSIEEILVKEGQTVRKGDVILRLNASLLQAEVEQARAQTELNERNYQRALQLLERGVLNRSEVEQLETRFVMSRSALAVAETNLERTTVASPVAGVLNSLKNEEGEYVAPGDTVAQVVVVDRVKATIQIPERDVRFLYPGKRIEVTVDALDNLRVAGHVSFMSEVADEQTRTTRVEVTLDNAARRLRSGMIVRARIARQILRDVIMIPLSSIIPLEDGRMVYVVNEGQAERREVVLGMIRGSQVQILEGLHPGDLLIVRGHRQVGPGQQVRVIGES